MSMGAIAALLVASACAASAADNGRPSPSKPFQPATPKFVIGEGRTAAGLVQVSAYGIRNGGLCVDTVFVKPGSSGGSCGAEPDFDGEITIDGETHINNKRRITSVTGPVGSAVNSVQTIVNARHRHSVRGIIARPDAETLKMLHAKPFAIFVSVFRGCVSGGKTRSIARDAAGATIGSVRGFTFPKEFRDEIPLCERGTVFGGFVVPGPEPRATGATPPRRLCGSRPSSATDPTPAMHRCTRGRGRPLLLRLDR
jgi:hypothetical protein